MHINARTQRRQKALDKNAWIQNKSTQCSLVRYTYIWYISLTPNSQKRVNWFSKEKNMWFGDVSNNQVCILRGKQSVGKAFTHLNILLSNLFYRIYWEYQTILELMQTFYNFCYFPQRTWSKGKQYYRNRWCTILASHMAQN